jgi:hypothetical protein
MKTFKRITWGLLIFLAVVYILPAAVLQVPYVQKNISNKTTEYLETKLGTKVHIQSIKLELFNRLILKNVLMEDQAGDTLFIAKRIGAGFEFLPLFKSKFYFNSAQLYSFTLNLNRETTDSPLNLQYIMDAFRKKDTIENSAIDVKIKDMDLRLGNFTYRIKDKASTANLFNPNDLHFQKISTRIKVRKWTDKELDIRLNKLSLTEKTGLQVKHLSFDLFADTLKAEIKKLRLELPSSKLQIADIYLNYGEKKSVTEMPFHLFIELSDISLKDLSSIVPTFSLYNDKVTVQGDFSGTINDFTCNRVSIHCDDELLIQAHARIQNATEPYPNAIYMNGHVEKSNVNASVIQRIIYNLGEKGFVLPEQIQNLGNISFNGELAGNMDNLNAHGYFSTEPGNLIVDITLGKKQDLFIKGQISSSDFDLKQLMKDDNFGTTTFNIDVNTSLNKSNRASGYLDAHISSLEYKRYDYENIHLNGEFAHSCFNGSLNIENPNGKHSEFNLSASASNIRLDKLNLTKKFQNPLLSFAIDARFTGNEIDNLLGKLHLHDLSFSTNKDNFILDNFEIQTNRQDTIKEIHVVSDFINGNIKGIYSIKSLIPELKQTLAIYLPSLFREKKNSYEKKENDFSLDFTFHNSKDLTSILEFPIVFYNPSRITGYYNNSKNELKVNADIPLFKVAGTVFEEGELNLRNKEDYVRLELKGSLLQKEKKIGVNVSFTAENDFIHSSVFWKNTGRQRHEGKLEFTTCFNGEREGPPAARIDIKR